MADVVVNFKGAEPVAGGARFDRVPEGTYIAKVAKADVVKTRTDKPALNVTFQISKGPAKGKKVSDWFVLPRKGTDDSIFGVQRLHGLMVACGLKKQTGKVPLSKIAKALKGKECVAEIADTALPETENQKEKIVSSPQAYYAIGSKEGKEALGKKASTDEDEEETEDEEDEEEDEEEDADDEGDEDDEESEDEDEEDEDEEEKEAPRKKGAGKTKKAPAKSKAKGKKKSKKAKDEDDEEDDEDLYDEDEDED